MNDQKNNAIGLHGRSRFNLWGSNLTLSQDLVWRMALDRQGMGSFVYRGWGVFQVHLPLQVEGLELLIIMLTVRQTDY